MAFAELQKKREAFVKAKEDDEGSMEEAETKEDDEGSKEEAKSEGSYEAMRTLATATTSARILVGPRLLGPILCLRLSWPALF